MTRQLWAETATAEVFGQSISCAPTWNEKFQAAEFAFEEAQHSQMLIDLLEDLGEDVPAILDARPDAENFWHLDLDDWVHIAVFNFTVDRGGSQQIMELRQEQLSSVGREDGRRACRRRGALRQWGKQPTRVLPRTRSGSRASKKCSMTCYPMPSNAASVAPKAQTMTSA